MRKIARKITLALLVSISLAGPVAVFAPGHAQAQGKTAAFAGAMPGSFADLVQNLLPAVVNISSTQKIKSATDDDQNPFGQMPGQQGQIPGMPQLPPGSPFEDFLNQFMQKHGQQMPMVPAASLGSGFIIDADKGYVITNNHVVDDADEVRVTLHDDTTLPATVVGRDEKVDIAVLQIKPEKNMKLSAVKFGDSGKSRIGDWVLAIGNPFGLGGTVTAGIVSAESRDIQAGPYDDFIQTDASINRGNPGGPMFNVAGEVIGINTAIFSPTGGSVGIGFAVPSNLAKPVIDQIIKFGHTRRGWIGVRIQAVTPDIAESLTLPASKGALIASVTATGPAQKAGLQPGDVILNFDGKEINAMRSLPLAVAESEIGKNVKIGYWREGKKAETSVVIGELEKAEKSGLVTDEDSAGESAPPSADQGVKVPDVGMVVGVITPADRNSYNIPDDVKGVLVMKVTPMSEAAKKGMEAGDVIVEIAKQRVSDPAKVPGLIASAIKGGTPSALLLVNRGGDVRFVALKPEPAIEKTKATKEAPKADIRPGTAPDPEPDAPTEQ
jgi:serine protease Do